MFTWSYNELDERDDESMQHRLITNFERLLAWLLYCPSGQTLRDAMKMKELPMKF